MFESRFTERGVGKCYLHHYELDRGYMDAMFAMVSAVLILIGTLCIFDSIAHRKYKEMVFFIAIIIFSAVMCYVSLSNLPDSHNHPWYWTIAAPIGIFLCGVIGAFFVFSTTEGRNKRK
jgi:peptidoglycan/LPS O-acetylase OafA/YrhL